MLGRPPKRLPTKRKRQVEQAESLQTQVNAIDTETQKNAALAEEMAASSSELLTKSDELTERLTFFTLSEEENNPVIVGEFAEKLDHENETVNGNIPKNHEQTIIIEILF